MSTTQISGRFAIVADQLVSMRGTHGSIIGVLDVDSDTVNQFAEGDLAGSELVGRVLETRLVGGERQ